MYVCKGETSLGRVLCFKGAIARVLGSFWFFEDTNINVMLVQLIEGSEKSELRSANRNASSISDCGFSKSNCFVKLSSEVRAGREIRVKVHRVIQYSRELLKQTHTKRKPPISNIPGNERIQI